MTKKDLKEANEWCKRLGLPPITFAELKRDEEIRKLAWGFAYTSNGVKYFT